jgi:fucose 4-O-acetylase-like acetyltransferase
MSDANAPTVGRKVRDPWLDNARFLAATLILVVHFAKQVPGDSTTIDLLNYATWPMRVPLYALVAGFFSSAAPLDGRRAVALLRNVLFVYLAFELLATAHKWALTGVLAFNPAEPSFALWFLLALFLWRVTLPLVANLRFLLPVAVAASAVACLVPSLGADLAAARTIGFWPVFLVGWKLKQVGLHRVLGAGWVRFVAAAVLLAWAAFCYVQMDTFEARWFSMRKHHSGTMAEELTEALVRLGLVTVAVLGALALLALVPRRRLWAVTYLGSGSLYVYLLHPFVLREVERTDYFESVDSLAEILLLLVAGALLACVLASPPVRRALRWLVQPRYTWPFVTAGAPAAAIVEVRPSVVDAVASAATSATPSPAGSRADRASDQPSAR